MELPAGVNRRYASVAGLALIAVWCWVAFDRPYSFPNHTPWNIYANRPQASPPTDVFNFPPLISPAIKDVCAKTNWNSSIIFTCDESSGGVAEVRNSILNCVRYAMIAGGSLVVPSIVVGEKFEDVPAGNKTEMEYMFDTIHFMESLALSCPQMQIYSTAEEVKDQKQAYGPIKLRPGSLVKNPHLGDVFAEQWKEMFQKWLSQYLSPGSTGPIIVELGKSYLQYPIASDGPGFSEHFGKLLKIRSDIRNLATTTLLKLSETHQLSLDLSQPMLKDSFLGAYLSTDHRTKDLPKEDRANAQYIKQSKLYLDQASSSNLPIIYVASENGPDIPHFITDALERNITVTTKLDLLKGRDREYLLEMTTDQRSLVDFLVLAKASDFAGVGHSSFAWNVALKRHQFFTEEKSDYLDRQQMLSDPFSQIYGAVRGHPEYAACMWP